MHFYRKQMIPTSVKSERYVPLSTTNIVVAASFAFLLLLFCFISRRKIFCYSALYLHWKITIRTSIDNERYVPILKAKEIHLYGINGVSPCHLKMIDQRRGSKKKRWLFSWMFVVDVPCYLLLFPSSFDVYGKIFCVRRIP